MHNKLDLSLFPSSNRRVNANSLFAVLYSKKKARTRRAESVKERRARDSRKGFSEVFAVTQLTTLSRLVTVI